MRLLAAAGPQAWVPLHPPLLGAPLPRPPQALPVDQVGERLNQLFTQPWLQGSQSTKLGDKRGQWSPEAGWDGSPGLCWLACPGHPRGDTCQFDNLNEDPVVGGGGHELEEERSERKVVLGVTSGQLTDDIDCRRLDP